MREEEQATGRARSSGTLLCATWVPGVEVEAALNTYYTRNEDDPMSDYDSLTVVVVVSECW